jgi:hypothetical protein
MFVEASSVHAPHQCANSILPLKLPQAIRATEKHSAASLISGLSIQQMETQRAGKRDVRNEVEAASASPIAPLLDLQACLVMLHGIIVIPQNMRKFHKRQRFC